MFRNFWCNLLVTTRKFTLQLVCVKIEDLCKRLQHRSYHFKARRTIFSLLMDTWKCLWYITLYRLAAHSHNLHIIMEGASEPTRLDWILLLSQKRTFFLIPDWMSPSSERSNAGDEGVPHKIWSWTLKVHLSLTRLRLSQQGLSQKSQMRSWDCHFAGGCWKRL